MDKPGRIRNKLIHVFLTEKEKKLAQDKAAYLGITTSELVRKLLADGYVINFQAADIKTAIREINKIGTNINQIARHANEVGAVSKPDFAELKNAYGQLFDQYLTLMLGQPKAAAESQAQTGGDAPA